MSDLLITLGAVVLIIGAGLMGGLPLLLVVTGILLLLAGIARARSQQQQVH